MGNAIIVAIIIVICFIGVRGAVKRVQHGCCGAGGDTVKKVKAQDQDISHYTYTYLAQVTANVRWRMLLMPTAVLQKQMSVGKTY